MMQKILSLNVSFALSLEEALHCACGLDELLANYPKDQYPSDDVKIVISTLNAMRKSLIRDLSERDFLFYKSAIETESVNAKTLIS